MANPLVRHALDVVNGWIGEHRTMIELKPLLEGLLDLERITDELNERKAVYDAEIATLAAKRDSLAGQVRGLEGTIETAMAKLDADIKVRSDAAGDEFAAKRESMTRTLENLTTLIGDAQQRHDGQMESMRAERERLQSSIDMLTSEFAHLKAKLG